MSNLARDILLSVIAGDALGTPLDGMGRGHISSCFGSLSGYVDPEPALKGKMDRWKKPGLYSSITQFMLLLGLTGGRRGAGAFARSLASSPALAGAGENIFRHTDAAERGFLAGIGVKDPSFSTHRVASTRIIAALAPLALAHGEPPDLFAETIGYLRLFTADPGTLAAGLLYSRLLKELQTDASDPVHAAIAIAGEIEASVSSARSAAVFAAGINPDSLAAEARGLAALLSLAAAAGTDRIAEDIICAELNRGLKNPVTRATLNNPAALVTFAVMFAYLHREDAGLLYRAAAEGGSSSSFTAIVGALSASARQPAPVPDELLQGLVNRKRITSIVDALAGGRPSPALAEEFMRSEVSLTSKADEELKARTKHVKKKPGRKEPTRADREKTLARHVVESWTKLDKARWKKERKQKDLNGDN